MSERKLDQTVVDEDFILTLQARENMSDPCYWIQGSIGFGTPQACWMGHIGKLMVGRAYSHDSVWSNEQWNRLNSIAEKLGFLPNTPGDDDGKNVDHPVTHMTRFNDSHDHEEVLAEFDKRIEAWRKNLS